MKRGEVVVTYRCTDGVEYDTAALADWHQLETDLYTWVNNSNLLNEGDSATLAKYMIDEAGELVELLNSFRGIGT